MKKAELIAKIKASGDYSGMSDNQIYAQYVETYPEVVEQIEVESGVPTEATPSADAQELRRQVNEPTPQEIGQMTEPEKVALLSKKLGISYEDAYDKVSRMPYSARQYMQGEPSTMDIAGAGVKDVSSYLGRLAGSAMGEESMVEGMGSMKGDNLGQEILRDPYLPIAVASGMGAGYGAKQAGLSGAAKLGTIGLLEGGSMTGAKQALGDDQSLGDLGFEVATGLGGEALGQGIKAVGPYAKKMASKVMDSKINALDRNVIQGYKPETIFEKNLQANTIGGLERNIEKRLASIGEDYNKALKVHDGKPIDITQAYSDAIDDIGQRMSKGELASVGDGVEAGAEKWSNAMERLMGKDGTIEIGDAIRNFRKELGRASKFGKKSDDPSLTGQAEFARAFRAKLNEQISKIAPEVRTMDKEISEIRPLQDAVEHMLKKRNKNKMLGLTDWPAIIAGGMVGGAGGGGLGVGVGGLGLLGGKKFLESSAGARTMNALGDVLPRFPEGAGATMGSRLGELYEVADEQ